MILTDPGNVHFKSLGELDNVLLFATQKKSNHPPELP